MNILLLGEGELVDAVSERLPPEHSLILDHGLAESCEMVIVCNLIGVEMAWLVQFLESKSDGLRLAHYTVCVESESWHQMEHVVDDLFTSAEEIAARVPFLKKRLELRESRRRQFSAIFQLAVDGIIIINTRGIVVRFNRAAELIFQYEAAEVIGQNVSMLMTGADARNHDDYLDRYAQTGNAKVLGVGREVEGRRKDGSIFPLDLALSEFESDGSRFYSGIIRDISDRRRLEHEVLRISEQERRRVGQDLHDGLGQMLTGISLISKNIAQRLEAEKHELADELFELTDLMREADRTARNIARGLVPVEMEGNGLSSAFRSLCKHAGQLFSVNCTYSESGNIEIRDSSTVSNLYRIGQESISNAVKHGKAENIELNFSEHEGEIVLTVTDDGIGFPKKLKSERGMGVDVMKYRARVIDARLSISSRQEGGTMVRCVLSLSDTS